MQYPIKTSFGGVCDPKPIKLPKVTGWVVNKRPTFQLEDFASEYTKFDQEGFSHEQFQAPEIPLRSEILSQKPFSGWNNHQRTVKN